MNILFHLYIDHDGFRRFVASLNPQFKMVSCNSCKDDCMKFVSDDKASLTGKFMWTLIKQ